MTPDEVRLRVAAIAERMGDPEAAHIAEDHLYTDVLRAIADGADQPADLAAAALDALELDYRRWYA